MNLRNPIALHIYNEFVVRFTELSCFSTNKIDVDALFDSICLQYKQDPVIVLETLFSFYVLADQTEQNNWLSWN